MPHPSHPSWFDHPNNNWQGVQIKKLLITQFSPASPFGTKISTPCSKTSSTYVLPLMWQSCDNLDFHVSLKNAGLDLKREHPPFPKFLPTYHPRSPRHQTSHNLNSLKQHYYTTFGFWPWGRGRKYLRNTSCTFFLIWHDSKTKGLHNPAKNKLSKAKERVYK